MKIEWEFVPKGGMLTGGPTLPCPQNTYAAMVYNPQSGNMIPLGGFSRYPDGDNWMMVFLVMTDGGGEINYDKPNSYTIVEMKNLYEANCKMICAGITDPPTKPTDPLPSERRPSKRELIYLAQLVRADLDKKSKVR